MLQRGAEVSVVLPYNEEEFVRDSVDFVAGSNWPERFRRVLARATRVLTASSAKLAIGGVSYEFCNQFLLGLGMIRARQLKTELIPLVVWDGQPGDGPGGASSVVENWRALRCEPEIIFLEKKEAEQAARDSAAQAGPEISGRKSMSEQKPAETPGFNSRLVSILFADAVGFSKLTETGVPLFVEEFLGAIARLSATFASSILARNTWGDGLYFIFSAAEPAGDFALQLADLTTRTNWEEKGLPAGLNLRIALHAGPAYEFNDPITGVRSYSGTHVNRAARLEPITPTGQVYSSEAFAALAAALRSSRIRSEYVGQTPMAKGYGTLPTYHVRRKSELS
jgi:class 3 adenylate cyclase